jgi:SNF2-related domain
MQLAPVQLEAITRADGRRGFAYFMEMGLGKTLTVLTEFRIMRKCRSVERLVVICPNSFKGGWGDEIDKHGFRDLFPLVYESSRKQHILPEDNVLIINYEAARTPAGTAMIVRFTSGHDCYLALDESIKLKNKSAKQTEAIVGKDHKRYPKPGLVTLFKVVRVLSGKPMTQGPHDLWAQLKAIGAMPLSYWGFKARFCMMGGWMDKQVIGILNEDLLRKMIEPVSFLAKKKDWLQGLPTKVYTTRRYPLGPVLQKHYDEMEEDFLTYIEGELFSVQVAIAKWEKCSQIQCGFILEGGWATDIVTPEANPRLQLLKEILDEEVTGKAVVVYRHKHVGQMLYEALLLWGANPAWIRGRMTPTEIDYEKQRFDTPGSRIMLLQAEAGKYGHTLLGTPDDPCSTMIFFENSYSLDTRSQIEDRIHRMGAVAESCLYVDLSGSDYDAGIARALQRKEKMFLLIFNEEEERAA